MALSSKPRSGCDNVVIAWSISLVVRKRNCQVTVWFYIPTAFVLSPCLSFSYYSGYHRIFNNEKPLSALVFNAWLFADPNLTIEHSTSLMLHRASTDLAPFVQKFVIEDQKVFALRNKLRDALKTAIDEPLEWVFGIASKLATPGNLTLRLEMIAERADVKVIVACNR